MKKILVAHDYSSDSFAVMSKELAIDLATEGNDIYFISHKPRFDNNTQRDNVNIFSWSEKRPTGLKSLIFYYKLHQKIKPNIVITHFGATNIIMIISFLFKTKKRICYYHTLYEQILIDHKDSIFKRIRKSFIYLISTDIIAVSDYAKKDILKFYFFIRKRKVKVVHNGIIDRYKHGKNDTLQPKGDIIINYLGRLDASKGILQFVKNIIKLNNNGNIKLNIAGAGSQSREVKNIIEGHRFINFFGKLEYKKIDDYIKFADFIIVPSIIDNLPTTAIEALMNGVPVIANRVGGISEIISDNSNGFLMDGLDLKSTEMMLRKLKRLNKTDMEILKRNARNSYLNKFTISLYILNVKKILNV